MKAKFMYFAILVICVICVVSAGLLSVHRSEGRVLPPEVQAQIEQILEQLEQK